MIPRTPVPGDAAGRIPQTPNFQQGGRIPQTPIGNQRIPQTPTGNQRIPSTPTGNMGPSQGGKAMEPGTPGALGPATPGPTRGPATPGPGAYVVPFTPDMHPASQPFTPGARAS